MAAAFVGEQGSPDEPAGLLRTLAGAWFAPPLAIALALLLLVVNEAGYRMVSSSTQDRDEIVAARIAVGRLRTAIITAESAQRGLLLTERPVYRESFLASREGIGAMITEARHSALKRPDLDAAVKQIIEMGERKLSEMQETVNLLDRGQRESAMALVLSDIGRDQMVDINQHVDSLVQTQNLETREAGLRRDQVLLVTRYSILVLVLACLAAALAAMRLIRIRDAERLGFLAALRTERDKLQERVAENTRALTELALHLQTVREDERSHLARELHDELGGLLTAAKLDLARMRSRLAQAGPEVAERLLHLRSTLDAGIALKRRIIEDLRPSSLDNLGLSAALQILCTEWSQRSDLKVEIDLQEVTLTPGRALAVYRLVQEALTNISKYAQANQVWVSMQAEAGEVHLTVRDDGLGFEADRRTPGHGLAGMRFRVASCDGVLAVESAPGCGTTIRARLPLV